MDLTGQTATNGCRKVKQRKEKGERVRKRRKRLNTDLPLLIGNWQS